MAYYEDPSLTRLVLLARIAAEAARTEAAAAEAPTTPRDEEARPCEPATRP